MRCRWMLALSCATGCVRERADLVDHGAWVQADAASDPWDDRPDVWTCPPIGTRVEVDQGEAVLEVETGLCSYFTASQVSLVPVQAGDRVDVPVAYAALTAPGPAEGHVALLLGDEVVAEVFVPIPSPAGRAPLSWVATQDVPEGTPVWLHVHNHGANTWNVGPVRSGPDVD